MNRQLLALASVLLFVASVSRYWVSFNPGDSVPFDPEASRLAHGLYDEGTFANPFAALDTGPSAHLAPVFPAFMALLMKVFGDLSAGAYAIKLAAVLILSLQLALYPVFSKILGMGEINGIIGAWIWLIAKPSLVYDWEALYAALLIAVACCCYRLYVDKQGRTMAWLLGCLMGFTILTLPTVAPLYAIWLAWEMWHRKGAFFRRSLVPLIVLPIVIITPWMVRNYLTLHRLMLRDDFGLELSVSNNDCARFGLRANMATGCFDEFHPNHNVNEAREVLQLGEVEYNDLRLREALLWIGSHPVGFIKLSLTRLIAFWMPTETFTIHDASGRRLERVTIYLMTLLSVPGLVILYRRDVTSAAVLLSCLTVFPLIYYVVQFEDRYRYPVMWVTFLLGALPITTCARRLRKNAGQWR